MIALIQKSGPARVEVEDKIVGQIENGLVILLGITQSDTSKDIDYLVEKIINLRLFENEGKDFDQSILETGREILLISQFTLYASCNKGRRPDFTNAAKRDIAEPLYEELVSKLRAKNVKVKTGTFGAMMQVHLVNEGPITIILNSKDGNN